MLIADERDIAVELLLGAAIGEVGRRIQLKSAENPGPKKAENWGPKTRPTHETENEEKEMLTNGDPPKIYTIIYTDDIETLHREVARPKEYWSQGTFERTINQMAYTHSDQNKNYSAELTRVLNGLLAKFGNSVILLKFLRGCLVAFNKDNHVPSEAELMVQLGLRKPYKPRHLKRDPFYVED